ncbi:tRNA 2-thiouridine synthesizing protein A [Lipingzhangella halophila]|uniref:tRNA 2-thiouridine synthesizing protein A n=1 Tax=Lipingzhangella halophila TaxID=1783352 RepID=A0A7W7RJ59_9ACTN|nr:sulfurtransferase TusA family protein [Lipingzhangella halophila]MBB4932842.1 tRNA 2-thiouridine synthesizing protein A [Lipingzhangella halophila]
MSGAAPLPGADAVVDGTGLVCVVLLIRLRDRIAGLPAGTVVHVTTTDPAAPLDLPAWCHLTGHTYLGAAETGAGLVHAVRVSAAPRPTRPDRPWHLGR